MTPKIRIIIEVLDDNGRPKVHWDMEENDATMKDVALLVYQMEQVKLGLVDREWDNGGEGYEIIGE